MLKKHFGYVSDSVRLKLFWSAISQAVKPEHKIADLGCGSGVLGLLCLRAGADQVFAVDSTSIIEVARETLERAGFGDRSSFVRRHSLRVALPEPVDVVICDHVGYFGFDYGIVHTLQDARRRFLKPGGRLIPRRIKLWLSAVDSPACYELAGGWRAEGVPAEFHWLRQKSVNARYDVKLKAEELASVPAALGEIDFHVDNPEFFSWTADLRLSRDGEMHGLAGWFDCELAHGVWMTNSPLSASAINRPQAFLPIDEVVEVKAGEVVKATIMARPADYIIAWTVEFPSSGRRFCHSTWHGMVLSPEDMTRANPTRMPKLSCEGRGRIVVLSYCDGRRTVREVEEAVLRDHPDLLPSPSEISRFVAQVLGRDTD